MNGFYNGNFTSEYFIIKENEKKILKRLGALCGLAVCCYVLIQNVIVLFLDVIGLWDDYNSNEYFQSGADIIITFAGVLLSFAFFQKFMKKQSGVKEPIIFERKVSVPSAITAVIGGVGFCMAANIVSSVFISIMSVFGFQLTSPDVPMPSGAAGIFLSFIRVVIVAAMAEEISLRGYVMGNLKNYGDAFAIGVSAVIFALMHGNLIQSPFALIAGFVIGYFTVKTGTLWTGIAIHALNNFISLLMSYLLDYLGQETGAIIYALIVYGLSFIGVISALIFIVNHKSDKLSKGFSVLDTGEKVRAYFLNLPMIIAVLIMVYVTSKYVEFGW